MARERFFYFLFDKSALVLYNFYINIFRRKFMKKFSKALAALVLVACMGGRSAPGVN